MNEIRTSTKIESRESLYEALEQRMQGSYEQLLKAGEVETGSTYVKTFLLEFDWNQNEFSDQAQEVEFLQEALTIPAKSSKKVEQTSLVSRTDEPGFYVVDWPYLGTRAYLDTITDRRFWTVYSLSKAEDFDKVVHKLIESKVNIDCFWLWSDLLKQTQALGESRGFKTVYNNADFQKQSGVLNRTNPFNLEASGDDDEIADILKFIYEHPRTSGKTSLAKIRTKYLNNPERLDLFTIDTIYFNGKFVSNGTSFASHKELVDALRQQYSRKIIMLEENHRVHVSGSPGKPIEIEGEPIFFHFDDKKIEDLDNFCTVVFSGDPPFRLWGIPCSTGFGENGRTVQAVDLHSGGKLFFEIYPEFISMYLSRKSCGNSAARFFTNIQRTFSRLVSAKDNAGSSIF